MEIDVASATFSFQDKKKKKMITFFSLAGVEKKKQKRMGETENMVCHRILMRLICFRNTLSSNLIL